MADRFMSILAATVVFFAGLTGHVAAQGRAGVVASAKSGNWSDPATWTGNKVPGTGARVQIKPGHVVIYDRDADVVLRAVHVAGTLRFARDRDTQLCAGLITVQPGDEYVENGFDCSAHATRPDPEQARAALEVGTPDEPIPARHRALIRLYYLEGMSRDSCPAIVCCAGKMDFHGAPMNRTWVRLGATVKKGDDTVTLADAVTGWKVGDRVIVTATQRDEHGGSARPSDGKRRQRRVFTEERIIKSIAGTQLSLDRPLAHEHKGDGEFRGEVAVLSRNVVIESADPAKGRGHTMYHRYSAGSISYSEFRHLGKEGILGRYSIHFHLVGDSMRGSFLVGNSVWDSANRWITIHGTNYLVVRDNVGYQSVGHGYFLEDGTEVYNIIDRNLAVQSYRGKPLPKQVLPFDQNEGSGFWWTNSRNTFTRNVACENDQYGYRYEATSGSSFRTVFNIRQPDGTRKAVDVRTLPFIRFDSNECHSDGLYGFNLGEGVQRVGPDQQHPFIIRNMKIWNQHYAFRPQVPSLLVENMKIDHVHYGVYHPNYNHHVYRNLHIAHTGTEPFNRGHDDDSIQYGPLAVDGLTFEACSSGGMPLIQITDDNPTGKAESHFRNLKLLNWKDNSRDKAIVNLGGGPRPDPKTARSVPVFIHDWFGPGRHAMVVSTRSGDYRADSGKFQARQPLTGDESRAMEVKGVPFPKLLTPVDDLPPATVITHVKQTGPGKLLVRGETSDNGEVKTVLVNNRPARPLAANFAQWEIVLENLKAGDMSVEARADDAAGNVEITPHRLAIVVR